MKELLSTPGFIILVLVLIVGVFICVYAFYNLRFKKEKQRIVKFNEMLTELLALQKVKENPKDLNEIMTVYAELIGLKSDKKPE